MSTSALCNNLELNKFLKKCAKEQIKCKVIIENSSSSWEVHGQLEDTKARDYLDSCINSNSEPQPLKPIPELPVNYSSLLQDQLKMCTFATTLVKLNGTGNIGEGIIII